MEKGDPFTTCSSIRNSHLVLHTFGGSSVVERDYMLTGINNRLYSFCAASCTCDYNHPNKPNAADLHTQVLTTSVSNRFSNKKSNSPRVFTSQQNSQGQHQPTWKHLFLHSGESLYK
ncbi:hypothetical protein C8Q75DRAFT_511752 [Abortiporus biennis]|nr:hypothetical protein C8Q75DRAFT_511752 [Abortiporus biennis]